VNAIAISATQIKCQPSTKLPSGKIDAVVTSFRGASTQVQIGSTVADPTITFTPSMLRAENAAIFPFVGTNLPLPGDESEILVTFDASGGGSASCAFFDSLSATKFVCHPQPATTKWPDGPLIATVVVFGKTFGPQQVATVVPRTSPIRKQKKTKKNPP
jgi:hypothetical protein